jgi:hypothetical protein
MSEDGRHPPAFIAQLGVAHGVNTSMNAVQASGGDPAFDRARIGAGSMQLNH